MYTTNSILILLNILSLFLSCPLPKKQPIKVNQHNISTPKTGIQDLVATHYDCSPKHITNMQYYKLNKIGECKIRPADFKILQTQVNFFHKSEHYKYALTPYTLNLAIRKNCVAKLHSKEVLGLITIIGMLIIWNDLSFPQKLKLVENFHTLV